MGVRLIGNCRICRRTRHCLRIETELCPRCETDPEAARQRRSKFLCRNLIFWWPLGLVLYGSAAYGLDCLFRYLRHH